MKNFGDQGEGIFQILVLQRKKTFYYFKTPLGVTGPSSYETKLDYHIFHSFFFIVAGFLILHDNYTRVGIWLQLSDLHHKTFAMSSFAFAIGIIVGAIVVAIKK